MAARHRDNNMRAAIVHVMADAAVSVLVIVGLLLARAFGWLWMDPLAGIGALVIANWSVGLIRDTGSILLDTPGLAHGRQGLRRRLSARRPSSLDLHLWRLGRAISAPSSRLVSRKQPRDADYYRDKLARFRSVSHLTVEVTHRS